MTTEATQDAPTDAQPRPAVAGQVERPVSRPAPERSAIRQYLIDYWEGEDDHSLAHAMIFAASDFEAVRTTVAAFSQHCDWLQQQCDERGVLKARLETAEAALASARQPLHAEMLRLNKRVIELTAELDKANVG